MLPLKKTLGECCPSGRDSSLNLLVLIFVSVAVSLSQVDVTLNVLDLGVVDIYWCVAFYLHLCLRLAHLQTQISLSAANPFRICCSSCDVLVHMSMQSSSRIWFLKSIVGICFRMLR